MAKKKTSKKKEEVEATKPEPSIKEAPKEAPKKRRIFGVGVAIRPGGGI